MAVETLALVRNKEAAKRLEGTATRERSNGRLTATVTNPKQA